MLDVLSQHQTLATFFLLGSSAELNPAVVRRIAAEGHELGNHTWEDECSARVPRRQLAESVSRTHRVLAKFGPVRLFRPGAGWTTPKVLAVARSHGYRCVLGSVYPQDVHMRSNHRIVNEVLHRVRPGAIIVLHEGTSERARVVPILEAVLQELRRRAYRVTTVSDLLSSSD